MAWRWRDLQWDFTYLCWNLTDYFAKRTARFRFRPPGRRNLPVDTSPPGACRYLASNSPMLAAGRRWRSWRPGEGCSGALVEATVHTWQQTALPPSQRIWPAFGREARRSTAAIC